MKNLMRKLSYLMIANMLLLSSAFAADIKVGYVDATRLLEKAPQAEAAFKLLKEEFSSRESNVIESQKLLKEMEEKLLKEGDFMSESERKKIEVEMLAKKRDLRRDQEELRDDFNLRRNEEIGTLQQYIRQAIEEVGKNGDFDLIFYEGIAYANSRTDITDLVLEQLRKSADKK